MTKKIEKIKEIFSSKEKFLENVSDIEFTFKRVADNVDKMDGNINMIEFMSYSAHDEKELGNFYDIFRIRGYYDLEIKSVENLLQHEYWVYMYKKYYEYVFYAQIVLKTYYNSDF